MSDEVDVKGRVNNGGGGEKGKDAKGNGLSGRTFRKAPMQHATPLKWPGKGGAETIPLQKTSLTDRPFFRGD